MSSNVLWEHPDVQSTRMSVFRRHVNRKYNLNLQSYASLHAWSVQEHVEFAQEIWDFCGVQVSEPPSCIGTGLDRMWPRPAWFPGARLNYTENVFAIGLASHPNAVAISSCQEQELESKHLTWLELRHDVEKWASALRNSGVRQGDRVAAVLSNSIECVVIFLASASIGAIFSSTSPDMGALGIIERYRQINPKILFIDTQVRYAGKQIDLNSKMADAIKILQTKSDLQHTVVVYGGRLEMPGVTSAGDFLTGKPAPLHYEQTSFDHPLYILYSSGTTGPPKCICHTVGGALLTHKKEHMLHMEIDADSVYYQYTTTGWMMWNYMIGALASGARIVLYDGSPLHPTPGAQLQILEREGVTHWGTSPKFLGALKRSWSSSFHLLQLEALKLTSSAGSPLIADLYHWFYDHFPRSVALISGSGGSDLVGTLVGGSPMTPVHAGEISCAYLGMKVEIWDLEGKAITDSGEGGELIVSRPFFSMPLRLWGDRGDEKYRRTYFETFPGNWCHGDYIRKHPETGGYEILGRSDGILNPGGVRFGTAELYGTLEQFPEIEDSIAVGQLREGDTDEKVLMFLRMRGGEILQNELRDRICTAIRSALSPRHVPAFIMQVTDIPYTKNGKKIENIVRAIVSGRNPKASNTISNPESLAEYYKFVKIGNPERPHALRGKL